MRKDARFICSLITVRDIAASRHFYEKVLAQKVTFDFGENVTFEGGFAIHLRPHFAKLIGGRTIDGPGNSTELYFEYDNVEQMAEQLRDCGAEFIHETREQPWRQKVLRVYDPDRYIVEIGESMEYLCWRLNAEGKTIEEISAITNMPADFAEESVKAYTK